MIIGIGTDIASIRRLEKSIQNIGEEILKRILTDGELATYHNLIDKMPYFAGRWAVKEAFSKAVGTGIGIEVSWKDCEVINLANGAPKLLFYGKVNALLNRLGVKHVHVSISHDTDYATALVILES